MEKFSEKKFSQTELEKLHRQFTQLPDKDDKEIDRLQRKEFDEAVSHMKNGKATGFDSIPVEVFKNSAVAKELLFSFL